MAMKSLSGEINQSSSTVSGAVTSTGRSYSANVINNDSPVYYTGAETDSLKLNVDNNTRSISGEVKWRSMLAMNELQEDEYHAYPANKARIMFSELQNELNQLAAHVQTLDSSCASSVQTIINYIDDLDELQKEIEYCKNSLLTLDGAISSEKIAREQGDINLRSAQTSAIERIDSEISQLTNDTMKRLDNQDIILSRNSESISNETSRATTEESRLDKRVDSVTKAIQTTNKSVEATRAKTENLNLRLNSLENSGIGGTLDTHEAKISEISTNVASIDLRTSTDISGLKKTTSELHDVVYKNSSKITEFSNLLKHTKDIVKDLKDEHASHEASIDELSNNQVQERILRDQQYRNLATSVMGESDVRRSTDEFHEQELARLEKRISNLQENMYKIVHDLGEELRYRDEELLDNIQDVSYSFIDGGNAPV